MARSFFESGPELSLEDFRLLRAVIQKFCGIAFADEMLPMVARRLRDRLGAVGVSDYGSYYRYLRYHPNGRVELEHVADALTTNETYFFREDYQLRALVRDVFPEIKRTGVTQRRHRLSIWSAGCSTGEEVYTLGMLIDDSRMFPGWDIRIFGSDISRTVVQTARHATYRGASFRAMPPAFERYFVAAADGREVRADIKAMCRFGHLNLLDAHRCAVVGQVDIIFCRNVLIYFDLESRRSVLDSFYERLVPGGYLFLGHSESLLNVTTAFELVHLSSDLVYRKPAAGA